MQYYYMSVAQVNLAGLDYVVAFIFKNSLSEKNLNKTLLIIISL